MDKTHTLLLFLLWLNVRSFHLPPRPRSESISVRIGHGIEGAVCSYFVSLYPGVWRARVLIGAVRGSACAGVKVHVVGGGFECVRLCGVVCSGVLQRLLQVRVVVCLRGLHVRPIRLVTPLSSLIHVTYVLLKETSHVQWDQFFIYIYIYTLRKCISCGLNGNSSTCWISSVTPVWLKIKILNITCISIMEVSHFTKSAVLDRAPIWSLWNDNVKCSGLFLTIIWSSLTFSTIYIYIAFWKWQDFLNWSTFLFCKALNHKQNVVQ